jgi:hypothetical protein
MTTQLDDLMQRLARAEHDIAALRLRHRRTRAIASMFALATVLVAFAGWSTATPQAQASGPSTVKAPFTVVSSENKAILVVRDTGVSVLRSDGAPIAVLQEAFVNLRAPVQVIDNASKPIVIAADLTESTSKDAKGVDQTITMPRGLNVFNGKAEPVARVAVYEGDGYVTARKGGQGTKTVGGVQGGIVAGKNGMTLLLNDLEGKTTVSMSSSESGLQFLNPAGTVLTEVNRTHFWMGNAAGAGIVEAGALPDGRGRVTVGPRFGGPQGNGQLTFPYMILGRK